MKLSLETLSYLIVKPRGLGWYHQVPVSTFELLITNAALLVEESLLYQRRSHLISSLIAYYLDEVN